MKTIAVKTIAWTWLTMGFLACTPRPQALTLPEAPAVAPQIPGLSRGLNVGNALDAPSEGAWDVTLSELHFRHAAEAGMDHIRLPIRWSGRAELHPPYTIEPEFFERVRWAVQQAHRYGLGIILDFHHYEEMMTDPEAHADRFVELWRQVAAYFANEPETVYFELLNEPCNALQPALLNRLHARAIEAIRRTNPTRTLILDSYFWAAAEYLSALEFPAGTHGDRDPHLVASFHMYQPILFTHQGAEWMEPWYQTVGIVFPGPPSRPKTPVRAAQNEPWVAEWFERYGREPADRNPSGLTAIDLEFGRVDAFQAETGRTVYLGEFAVIDNADPQSRSNWLRAVRSAAERRGIGWAYWDDGGRNLGIDLPTGEWVPEIAEGLGIRPR